MDVYKASTPPQKTFPFMLVAIAAAAITIVVAATLLYMPNQSAMPIAAITSVPQASQTSPTSRNAQTGASSESKPAPVALVPEDVPFIRDSEQAVVRNEYLSAPDHKALALSYTHAGFATDKSDDKSAIAAAMETCQAASDAVGPGYKCQLYAVGNVVVYKAGRPPMPSPPWIMEDPSVSRPFVAADAPMVTPNGLSRLGNYATAPATKVLTVSPQGGFSWRMGNERLDEAVRRSLEICGASSGFSCMVVAIDNNFVVPVPSTMKAIGFFQAASEPLISPELRPDLVRRLGNAPKGWKAVATGVSGRPSLVINAATEQAAVDGALNSCQANDRECKVIAIGPFRVAPRSPPDKPAQTSGQ
jgi:hypothetical protein